MKLPRIDEFNFGEFDARQEYVRNRDYFLSSFVLPDNFSTSQLRNNKRFIVVGRKGVGKSSCQLFVESELVSEGYLTGFLSFYGDLSPADYLEFQKTQKLQFLDTDYVKNISAHYDFRDVWRRVLMLCAAQLIKDAGIENSFTQFCLATKKLNKSIVDGISRSLKIDIGIDIGVIKGSLSFDPSSLLSDGKITLSDFNRIAEALLLSNCQGVRLFYSVDELVVSNFSATTDEFKVRLCLIRDVIKVANYFNDLFVKNGIDWHFSCSLRPEVRDQLNGIDAEISKIIDSNYIPLSWTEPVTEAHPLMQVLYEKVNHGCPEPYFNSREHGFFPESVSFGGGNAQTFPNFILNQGWFRPRDIVRFLKTYQAKNGRHTSITVDGIKNAMSEYSRISAKEAFDELAVKYTPAVIDEMRKRITKRNFANRDEMRGQFAIFENRLSVDELVDDLFHAGVISNVDYVHGRPRYFSSYREEEALDSEMKIVVHPGLWNFFNIRHR